MDPETTILEAEAATETAPDTAPDAALNAALEKAKGAAHRGGVSAVTVRGTDSMPPRARVSAAETPPAVYGICVVCHEKTPMARLVAIPATSLCLSCARKEQRWAVA